MDAILSSRRRSLMHMNRHRHLLVIDGPRVFGLVSIGDLVRQIIERGEGRFEAAVRETAPRIDR